MKFIYSFILTFAFSTHGAFSQDCDFDPYQKKGGLYYLSTFYKNYDPKQLWEGVCNKMSNGKPYAYREFKNGQLQVERLYQYKTGKVYSEFKRVNKDSIFAELIYKQDGSNIELKQTFYINKFGKRCWKEENYRQGKIYQVRFMQSFTNEELMKAGYPARPEHLIDAEGYCDVHAQFGIETLYHPNGKIQSITEHKLIVSDSPNYFPSQHGVYVLYAENGVELQRGTYANGQPNGNFVYHHLNGNLAAKKSFENGISVGNWEEYYDTGELLGLTDYGQEYYWPSGHEKRFLKSGALQFERVIDKQGKGFENAFFENGQLQHRIEYEHGPQERTAYYEWFENGKPKQKIFLRPKQDTLAVEYFADGYVKSINKTYAGYQRQEMRTYFTNHQLASDNGTQQIDGIVKQHSFTYAENGVLLTSFEGNGSARIVKHYWLNGKLKFEKQFQNNLLNGYWIEQDSLGNLTRKCHYTNGFRDTLCELSPQISLKKLEKAIEDKLLPLVISSYTHTSHLNNEIIREKEVNDRVDILRKTLQYLFSNHSNFQLHPLSDSATYFTYSFYETGGLYPKHQKAIDSLFDVMNCKTIDRIKTQGQTSYGRFSSLNLYSQQAIDSMFTGIFPKASGYISLNMRVEMDLDFGFRQQRNVISFDRKEAEKAWLVYINGSQVVVYDDGNIELYNGSEVVVYDYSMKYGW